MDINRPVFRNPRGNRRGGCGGWGVDSNDNVTEGFDMNKDLEVLMFLAMCSICVTIVLLVLVGLACLFSEYWR